jgi:hypothetical protein
LAYCRLISISRRFQQDRRLAGDPPDVSIVT